MLTTFETFLIFIFCVSLGINLTFYFIALYLKTDKFTDITYSATFVLLALVAMIWRRNLSVGSILVFLAIVFWGFRLGGFLFLRIIKMKQDPRFDKLRNSWWKFLIFWIIQAVTVPITIAGPEWALFDKQVFSFNGIAGANRNLAVIAIVFFFVAIFFLVYEAIADQQKKVFYDTKNVHKKPFINTGLYKYSLHPNYLGEMGFWLFLSLITIISTTAYRSNGQLINILWIISFLWIFVTIYFLSGIRMTHKRWKKKFVGNKEFFQYYNSRPNLIPAFYFLKFTQKIV